MIVTCGELLVEFISHEVGCGLRKTTDFSGPYASGAPAIFANQAARVGADVAIIGGVGDDPFGTLVLDRLKGDGVDTRHVTRSATNTTGTAFVSYYADGSRVFVFHLDGTAADQIAQVPTLDAGTILHISGASLGTPVMRQAIMDLVSQAKISGRICYDPNIRPELMQDPSIMSCITEIIDASDYLLPSAADLATLFPGVSDEDFIADMISRGKSAVVVKRGAKGVVGSDGGEIIRLAPHKVQEIDPTGAGDCFCGTLLGLLNQGSAFDKALNAANIAGALHVTQRGPMEWNPTIAEIRAQQSLIQKGDL